MRIGILGAGQLARMLSLAAYPLGWKTLCYSPQTTPCAADVTEIMHGTYDDLTLLKNFAEAVDVITYENENIPLASLQHLAKYKPCYPDANILAVTQDRQLEKQIFQQLDIPTARFTPINHLTELSDAVDTIGLPSVLKTRRFGYDGKGQAVIKSSKNIDTRWQAIQQQPAILEQWINFDYEVSLIAARHPQGESVYYPLTQNQHQDGILRTSRAPYNHTALWQQAREYVDAIMQHFNYVGILSVEFFVTGKQLIANEMAPRVHNSGHWTIEGANTSQFENHLRAIGQLALGDSQAMGMSTMYNCIGQMPPLNEISHIPYAHYHDYHKSAQPQRKVGHITIHASDKTLLTQSCDRVAKQTLKGSGA